MSDVDAVIRAYRKAAIGTSLKADVPRANWCAREVHDQYVILRESQVGRDAITSLLSDGNQEARLWAARHSLEWAPELAVDVLMQLSQTAGLLGFSARMTLKEYEKGRLPFGPAAGGPAAAAPPRPMAESCLDIVDRDVTAFEFFGPNPGAGDRAANTMYMAHGLIMNGGVLNFVEITNRAQVEAAAAGYRFFGIDGVADLILQAKSLVERITASAQLQSKRGIPSRMPYVHECDLGQMERQLDADYKKYIPDDSALQERYDQFRRARPADFVDW